MEAASSGTSQVSKRCYSSLNGRRSRIGGKERTREEVIDMEEKPKRKRRMGAQTKPLSFSGRVLNTTGCLGLSSVCFPLESKLLSRLTQTLSILFSGCAVRLAQELGIHNLYSSASERKDDAISWHEERCLRTWICSFPTSILSLRQPH